MREILYRGLNANGEFVYGLPYLDAPNSTAYYNDYSYRITWIPEKGGHANQPVKNGTIGQFTGLIDEGGVKIFEGDIVEFYPHGEFGEIFWNDEYSQFSINLPSGSEGIEADYQKYYKVIGNIPQNPELLEENTLCLS